MVARLGVRDLVFPGWTKVLMIEAVGRLHKPLFPHQPPRQFDVPPIDQDIGIAAQALVIRKSIIVELWDSGTLGHCAQGLVVLFSFGDLRNTLITVAGLPVCLIAAFAVMSFPPAVPRNALRTVPRAPRAAPRVRWKLAAPAARTWPRRVGTYNQKVRAAP